jgi:hypothetical protein
VKVMKASWLHVALNLKRIRQHELWRLAEPSCGSYDDYVLGVLRLNKYVAARMLRAVTYTEERRPELVRDFRERPDDVQVPSYETVDRLRRIQNRFEEREGDFRELESRVFDEGIGRVALKRAIDEKLAGSRSNGDDDRAEAQAAAAGARESLDAIVADLRAIQGKLRRLQVSGDARRLIAQLIEALE